MAAVNTGSWSSCHSPVQQLDSLSVSLAGDVWTCYIKATEVLLLCAAAVELHAGFGALRCEGVAESGVQSSMEASAWG